MSIQVSEFHYIPGENDAEYIKLLKDALKRQKKITSKAIAKVKELSKELEKYEWTACIEELPTERDWYLGVFKECDTGWTNPIPFVCDYVGRETPVTTKDYWIIKEHADALDIIDYYRNMECIAWTHLPDPFEERR